MSKTSLCIFCGKRADSREHVFPDWINREFKRPLEVIEVTQVAPDGTVRRFPTGQIASLTYPVVCGDGCNSAWMSGIEGRMKQRILSMIQGQPQILSVEDQVGLATWAALKAYIVDAGCGGPSIVTQAQRDIMRTQERPSADVRVSVAAHVHGGRFSVYRMHVIGFKKREDTTLTASYATTFVLGRLVLHVLGSTETDYRAFLSGGEARSDGFTLLPPVRGAVAWPPAHPLDDEELELLAKSSLPVDQVIDPNVVRPPSWPPSPAAG